MINTYHITENNSGGVYLTPHRFDNPFVVYALDEVEAVTAFENFYRLRWEVQNKYGPGGGSCEHCGVRFSIQCVSDEHDRAFERYISEVI